MGQCEGCSQNPVLLIGVGRVLPNSLVNGLWSWTELGSSPASWWWDFCDFVHLSEPVFSLVKW